MSNTLLRTDKEIEEIYCRQIETVYRVCLLHLKNQADAEDAAQAVFLKLMEAGPVFQNQEHEKAWLIVTASNHCKNLLKHWFRKSVPLEEGDAFFQKSDSQIDETLEQVLRLPAKYKSALYLFYYEGCSTAQIASILGRKEATVRSDLHRGRIQLKEILKEAYDFGPEV